jgi:AcrR family transcriptional regulator
MSSKVPDRRVQRSQQALHEALTALILEKRYDKITVQEIIDRANVGRSTFYAHFFDKEDLLVKGFELHSGRLHAQSETAPDGEGEYVFHSLLFFRRAHLHYHLHQAMVEGGGADLILKTVRHHLQEEIESYLRQRFPDEKSAPLPLPVIANFLEGAMIAVATGWLDGGQPYSPEEINDIFQQLVMNGIKQLSMGSY